MMTAGEAMALALSRRMGWDQSGPATFDQRFQFEGGAPPASFEDRFPTENLGHELWYGMSRAPYDKMLVDNLFDQAAAMPMPPGPPPPEQVPIPVPRPPDPMQDPNLVDFLAPGDSFEEQ